VYKNSHVIGLVSVCVCALCVMGVMGVSGLKKVGELKKDNRNKKKLLLGDRETQKQRDRDTQKQRDRKTETHRNRESGR
jgi:hypothetical protein